LRRPCVVVTWILGGFVRGAAPTFESCRHADIPLNAGMIGRHSKPAYRSAVRAVCVSAGRGQSGRDGGKIECAALNIALTVACMGIAVGSGGRVSVTVWWDNCDRAQLPCRDFREKYCYFLK
jgi:hypothetical protein